MNRIEWEWRKNARCEKSDSRLSNGKVHRKLSEWNPYANANSLSSSLRFVFSGGRGACRCFFAQTDPMTSSYFIATVFHCPFPIVSSWSRLAFAADTAIFRFAFYIPPFVRFDGMQLSFVCVEWCEVLSFHFLRLKNSYTHSLKHQLVSSSSGK